ncbi:MAG: cell division protein FtsL [Candidatus Binataceae bacterium]
MNTRPLPSRQPSKLAPTLLVVALAAAGFATVLVRLQITREGYRIAELRAEISQLENDSQRLKLEFAQLSAHSRLRELARRYELRPFTRGQVAAAR